MVYGHRESRKAGSKAKRKEQRHRKGHTTHALPPVHPPIKSTIGKQPHRNIAGKILRGTYKSYSAKPASLSPALARSLRVFWNLVESDF